MRLVLQVNGEIVSIQRVCTPAGEQQLQKLIQDHVDLTGSTKGAAILEDWSASLQKFWQLVPPSGRPRRSLSWQCVQWRASQENRCSNCAALLRLMCQELRLPCYQLQLRNIRAMSQWVSYTRVVASGLSKTTPFQIEAVRLMSISMHAEALTPEASEEAMESADKSEERVPAAAA